jgi:hypothetical protein
MRNALSYEWSNDIGRYARRTWYVENYWKVSRGERGDPETGYAAWIDVDSFIDHHILVELTKNIDGYRLSTFFYKEKDTEEAPGKLFAGPIWDYNLSLGNANYLQGWMPDTWYYTQVSAGDYPWWPRMQQDPTFGERYRERWREFRKGPLSIPSLVATIDAHVAEIRESAERNFVKWRILGRYDWPNWFIAKTWDEEVEWMTGWLRDRVAWMDGQFTETPRFSPAGGNVEKGTEVTLSVPVGQIYYTIDGVTDPRSPDGSVAPEAILYAGPIVITGNTRVSARSFAEGVWSAAVDETYITEVAPLAITELMYNPPSPPAGSAFSAQDFEFIEFQNVGDTPLDLSQFAFERGVRLDFAEAEGDVKVLAPGAHAVAVHDLAAFSERYGTAGIPIIGEYSGSFSDSGETVVVIGRLGEVVRGFSYEDGWHPSTDGAGDSLTLIDPAGTIEPEDLENPANWRPSSVPMGTPGKPDGTAPPAGMVLPGDTNRDARLNITDGVTLLSLLFGQPLAQLPCSGDNVNAGGNRTVFDANGDGSVNLTDGVHVLNYLFGTGDPHVLGAECVRVEGCEDTCN